MCIINGVMCIILMTLLMCVVILMAILMCVNVLLMWQWRNVMCVILLNEKYYYNGVTIEKQY